MSGTTITKRGLITLQVGRRRLPGLLPRQASFGRGDRCFCHNHHSVSFPAAAGAKLAQGPQFGSREWRTNYSADRTTIEGGNAYMKDEAHERLEAAGRRRIRGIAAQTLLIGFLVVSANLRNCRPPAMSG